MEPDKHFVLDALLQHNYLPVQKKNKDELPPVFSTEKLTRAVAEKVRKLDRRKDHTYGGYDQVAYRATRFNNVPRTLSIPHPKPYVDLAFCIHEQWDKLAYICTNKSSLIRPKRHKDGRIIIMDYEKSWLKTSRHVKSSFGCKFTAHTDIANCFPSIYSHSIPWALVGLNEAKKKKGAKHAAEWFNQIDEHQRMVQRNETHGVPIGPASSNVIVEIILARIDEMLGKKFTYYRFIDDYTCYCDRHETAEEFIRQLSFELSRYGLNLNIKKTRIDPLPNPAKSDWVIDLTNQQPVGKDIAYSEAVNYLDYAVSIHRREQDGSVLKFAVNTIKSRSKKKAIIGITDYVISLAYYYPILLPTLEELFDSRLVGAAWYEERLTRILVENAINYRSDGMCWSLYYLLKHKCKLTPDAVEKVLLTRDCFALLLVYLFKDHENEVVNFASKLDVDDLYGLDQYWPLLYQLFLDGKIANPYKDGCFEVLKAEGVTFLGEIPTKTGARA